MGVPLTILSDTRVLTAGTRERIQLVNPNVLEEAPAILVNADWELDLCAYPNLRVLKACTEVASTPWLTHGVLVVPDSVEVLEARALANSKFDAVVLGWGIKEIGSSALSGIHTDTDLTMIYAYRGTFAAKWLSSRKLPYTLIDDISEVTELQPNQFELTRMEKAVLSVGSSKISNPQCSLFEMRIASHVQSEFSISLEEILSQGVCGQINSGAVSNAILVYDRSSSFSNGSIKIIAASQRLFKPSVDDLLVAESIRDWTVSSADTVLGLYLLRSFHANGILMLVDGHSNVYWFGPTMVLVSREALLGTQAISALTDACIGELSIDLDESNNIQNNWSFGISRGDSGFLTSLTDMCVILHHRLTGLKSGGKGVRECVFYDFVGDRLLRFTGLTSTRNHENEGFNKFVYRGELAKESYRSTLLADYNKFKSDFNVASLGLTGNLVETNSCRMD
jgi:hypothetical protein